MRNLVFFLTLFSWLTACNNTKTIKLVTDGESPYTIVIPSHANEQENRAALLLQKYIKQISGCEIPVDSQMRRAGKGIFIREVSGLQYDGYRMKCSENGAVFIDGGKRKGCVYGVVTLLEDYLGCHVYSPTFKVVPQCRNIFLPIINQADSSINNYRIVNYFSGSYAGDEDLLDWNRLSKEYIFASHSFDWLVPWETYYKTHPEYYALRDGKRLPTQLCLTNKAVLTIAVDKLRKAIAGNPEGCW
jgi:hypothetical protein